MANLITRLFFDSFCLLIILIQKINSYPIHGFVSGSDTTEGELRSKTQRKLKFSPLEILTNGHDQ